MDETRKKRKVLGRTRPFLKQTTISFIQQMVNPPGCAKVPLSDGISVRWGSQVESSGRSLRHRGSAGLRGGPWRRARPCYVGMKHLSRGLYWSSDGSTPAAGKAVGPLEGAACLKEVGHCWCWGSRVPCPCPLVSTSCPPPCEQPPLHMFPLP